jgi:hypothetical protein
MKPSEVPDHPDPTAPPSGTPAEKTVMPCEWRKCPACEKTLKHLGEVCATCHPPVDPEWLRQIIEWSEMGTPGPWWKDEGPHADWGFVRGADGMPVVRTDMQARIPKSHQGGREPAEIWANAHLAASIHALLQEVLRARGRERELENAATQAHAAGRAEEREQLAGLVARWAVYWQLEGRSQHWDAADSLVGVIRSGDEPPAGEGTPSEEDRKWVYQKMGYAYADANKAREHDADRD